FSSRRRHTRSKRDWSSDVCSSDLFNMFEVLGINEELDAGEFGDLDTDTAKGILSEVATLTEGPVAESFASADRNPPVFDPDTHSVSIPEDFKKSFNAWYDAGYTLM